MSRGWRNWLQAPKEPKPERKGPFTFWPDSLLRQGRAADILKNRATLEEAARQLRLSSDMYCLQAATLVDAAIETLDAGLVNLCKDKPKNKPSDK